MNPKDLVGSKKAPLDLVPSAGAIMSAPAHQNGAEKYGAFNWRQNPVQLMTYLAAIQRHLHAFIDGQDRAEDTGIHHLSHMLASMNIVADAMYLGNLIDNRPPKGPAADMLREQDHSAKPADSEPKVYSSPSPTPENVIQFPVTPPPLVEIEAWGLGEGPIMEFDRFDQRLYVGEPFEEPDGCVNYRGRHVHPTVATPATYRDIDRDMDG